jgi:hypothetical protein
VPQIDREFGSVTVVRGDGNGKYPHGNSLWICGRDTIAIVDHSLTVVDGDEDNGCRPVPSR